MGTDHLNYRYSSSATHLTRQSRRARSLGLRGLRRVAISRHMARLMTTIARRLFSVALCCPMSCLPATVALV
uniref:Uncharacterized protein n=1 Tax=Trichogramma kaykai TaxID=54128 RepID=A0ABD2WY97_9HYME